MKTTNKLLNLVAAFRCSLGCGRHLEFAGLDPRSTRSFAAIDEALANNERQREDLLRAKAYLDLQRQRLAECGVDAPDGLGLREMSQLFGKSKAKHPQEWERLGIEEKKRQEIRDNLDAIIERG